MPTSCHGAWWGYQNRDYLSKVLFISDGPKTHNSLEKLTREKLKLKIKNKYTLTSSLIITAIVFFASTSQAFAQCDADVLRALQTRYGSVTRDNLGSTLHEKTCKTKSSSNSTGLDIYTPEYGNFGFSGDNASFAQSCYSKDYTYFENHAADIVFSFMPKEAFQYLSTCSGGLGLSVSKQDHTLRVIAGYTARGREKALVEEFSIEPRSAVRCPPNQTFRIGEDLIAAGRGITCTILRNVGLTISLNTSQGQRTGILLKDPEIKAVPYYWTYNLSANKKTYTCKRQNEEVGSAEYISSYMKKSLDGIIKGTCSIRHGKGKVIVDGTDHVQYDKWTYEMSTANNNRDPRKVQCKVDGTPIGPVQLTYLDGTWNVPEAITGLCAGRFGISAQKKKD